MLINGMRERVDVLFGLDRKILEDVRSVQDLYLTRFTDDKLRSFIVLTVDLGDVLMEYFIWSGSEKYLDRCTNNLEDHQTVHHPLMATGNSLWHLQVRVAAQS